MADDILNTQRDERFRRLHLYLSQHNKLGHALIEELEREHIIWEKHGLTQIVDERDTACRHVKELEAELESLRSDAALGGLVRRMPERHMLRRGLAIWWQPWSVQDYIGEGHIHGVGKTPEAALREALKEVTGEV